MTTKIQQDDIFWFPLPTVEQFCEKLGPGIGARAQQLFQNHGAKTLLNMVGLPVDALRRSKGAGKKTIEAIKEGLRWYNLHLGMTETEVEFYRWLCDPDRVEAK